MSQSSTLLSPPIREVPGSHMTRWQHPINCHGTEYFPPLTSTGLNLNEKTNCTVFSPKMLGFI